MLSDTLAEAREEIERYQAEYPDNYGPIAGAIEKIKLLLRAGQRAMDLCPTDRKEYSWEIIRAMENVDTAALEAVMQGGPPGIRGT